VPKIKNKPGMPETNLKKNNRLRMLYDDSSYFKNESESWNKFSKEEKQEKVEYTKRLSEINNFIQNTNESQLISENLKITKNDDSKISDVSIPKIFNSKDDSKNNNLLIYHESKKNKCEALKKKKSARTSISKTKSFQSRTRSDNLKENSRSESNSKILFYPTIKPTFVLEFDSFLVDSKGKELDMENQMNNWKRSGNLKEIHSEDNKIVISKNMYVK
jgi:hypothetical protein